MKFTFEELLDILKTLRTKYEVKKIKLTIVRTYGVLSFSQGKVYWDKDEKCMKLFKDEYKKIINYLDSLNLLESIKMDEDKITVEFYIKEE